ncbi:MAG: hypothetical protein KDD46_04710, partial [Bdellovibrionales bacterium]|nr:hypothetical protein [Bdellovibrionales bacterium]
FSTFSSPSISYNPLPPIIPNTFFDISYLLRDPLYQISPKIKQSFHALPTSPSYQGASMDSRAWYV